MQSKKIERLHYFLQTPPIPLRWILWLLELDSGNKEGEFQKKTTSASLTAFKPLTVCITGNWEILQEMGIPDHLSCLLSNLYAG